MVSTDKLIEQYGILGRTVSKMPFKERLNVLAKYRAAVHTQRHGSIGRKVETTFSRVSSS
jgi:hypothetical protein